MVLGLGGHNNAAGRIGSHLVPEQTLYGEVVALGSARGENHLVAIAVHRRGNVFAGLLNQPASALPEGVNR
jgi:hypothetical protein